MANYDKNFTDELRTRLSIVDVVSRRVPLTKKGQNYWGCCPFHNEKTPSFSVNEDKGFYHCFGCGEHGDIISFTMKSENVGFVDAIKELADMAGMKLPEFKPRDPKIVAREESYFDVMEHASAEYQKQLFTPAGAVALEYIRRRGFTDDMIKKYRLGYAPKNNFIANKFINTKQDILLGTGLCRRGDYGMYDFFRDKLMFPIFSARGQIVAFSGRSLDGSEPKYINTSDTEIFHKRKTIFGFNFARESIHRNNRTIIVEGQIDAIQMQCHGFPETVAPLGTALTEDHLAILCKANRNIVFCFDGDNAGRKAAVRAADIVLPFVRDDSDIRFAFVTGGKDPDEILKNSGADAMRTIIDASENLTDFLWNTANNNYIVSTPGGRAQAEKFLKTETSKIPDIALRAEYENEYNSRKFNQWHKWSRKPQSAQVAVPEIDAITRNTLIFITNKFPEIAERHAEFLAKLNISLDGDAPDMNMDARSAERYITSLKLQNYLKKLQEQKQKLTTDILRGDADDDARGQIFAIDSEIAKYTEKLEQMISD
mgnify:FL=1